MDEFFASGGTTSFVDRLCGALGIHASTVKVIGAKPGSVVVDYEITPSADEPLSIEQISARQTAQFATGQVDLGAPILDVAASGGGSSGDIISGGVAVAAGFPPKIITKTGNSALTEVWIEWLEPFAFSAF